MLAAAFGERVADPPAGQHVGAQPGAQRRLAVHGEHVDHQVVGLRDLGQRRVDGGDDPGDLGQRGRPQARAAVGGRHGDGEQAGAVELGQGGGGYGVRPVPVALDRSGGEGGGDPGGGGEGGVM
ncbi:hypothetical protein GCM10020358_35820 [Amorphoplanes nipponensis]